MADAGSVSEASGDWKTSLIVCGFCSIALYNFAELNAIIFGTFKKKSGLYFWSFLISSNGVAPYALGFLMKDLNLSGNAFIDVTLIVIGWVCTVTGQSVVLYSRLHLVIRNQTKLKALLIMIIINALVCHGPTTVMVYGANSANPDPWILPYNIYEKVEVTIFFLQELLLSGIYIYSTLSFFRLEATLHGKTTSQLMLHLVWINILIIVLDITILALEYAGFYDLQTAYKGLVYSVKLKLEFKILNGLVDLTRSRPQNGGSHSGSYKHRSSTGNSTHRGDFRGTTVAMDTFDGTRSRVDKHKGSDSGDHGYKAQVHTEAHHHEDIGNDGIMVMTTTEVNTTDADEWASRTTAESGDPERLRAVKSLNSSEVEFAKSPGY